MISVHANTVQVLEALLERWLIDVQTDFFDQMHVLVIVLEKRRVELFDKSKHVEIVPYLLVKVHVQAQISDDLRDVTYEIVVLFVVAVVEFLVEVVVLEKVGQGLEASFAEEPLGKSGEENVLELKLGEPHDNVDDVMQDEKASLVESGGIVRYFVVLILTELKALGVDFFANLAYVIQNVNKQDFALVFEKKGEIVRYLVRLGCLIVVGGRLDLVGDNHVLVISIHFVLDELVYLKNGFIGHLFAHEFGWFV